MECLHSLYTSGTVSPFPTNNISNSQQDLMEVALNFTPFTPLPILLIHSTDIMCFMEVFQSAKTSCILSTLHADVGGVATGRSEKSSEITAGWSDRPFFFCIVLGHSHYIVWSTRSTC